MEELLKDEVLKEIRSMGGKMLLHDEVETKPGIFDIVPIWEEVSENDVATPKELYEAVLKDNYHVDYLRVAIVSSRQRAPADIRRTNRRRSRRACRPLCSASLWA